jgi:hypothetical protein
MMQTAAAHVRDRKVQLVRVSPALEIESGPRTAGIPYLVGHVER